MSSSYTSKWRKDFQRLRAIQKDWIWFGAMQTENLTYDLSNDSSKAWEEYLKTRGDENRKKSILELRKLLHKVSSSNYGEIFEDVWHAALYIAYIGGTFDLQIHWSRWHRDFPRLLQMNEEQTDSQPLKWYRGQLCDWPAIPSLYRSEEDASLPKLNKRRHRLHQAVIRWKQLYPELTDNQAVALSQHYGEELNVKTWFLDFTRDPYIALWFATYPIEKIKEGMIGQVEMLSRKNLESLFPEGLLDQIEITLPFVPRPNAQRAEFLGGMHPHLWEGSTPHIIRFQQHSGVYFEDPLWGGDKSTLLPDPDPYRSQAQRIGKWIVQNSNDRDLKHDIVLEYEPNTSPSQPLTGDEYLKIVQNWKPWNNLNEEPAKEVYQRLKELCNAHARLWEPQLRKTIPLADRSLLKLDMASTEVLSEFGSRPLPKLVSDIYGPHVCKSLRL